MTYAEQTDVANIVGRLIDYQAHCFTDHDEAKGIAKEARSQSWSWSQANVWSEANVVVLAHHNLSGYVVRVVGESDRAVAVMFNDGSAVPLNGLRKNAEQGMSPWDSNRTRDQGDQG